MVFIHSSVVMLYELLNATQHALFCAFTYLVSATNWCICVIKFLKMNLLRL